MRTIPLSVLLLALPFACSEGLWVPAPEVTISHGVSGGFAGVAWGVTIDGSSGTIIGERCEGQLGCDWVPGETLGAFADSALSELARRFAERGFLDLEEDYGVECCDQFYFAVTYSDRDREHTVAGSEARLPQAVLELADEVMRFVERHRSGGQ